MEFSELLKFIEKEDQRLSQHYNLEKDKMILARTVKLTEELGELCNEILIESKLQRKDKLDNQEKDNLSSEFADVILCTLLLAKSMNVDIKTALDKKMEKIKKRNY